MRRAFDLDVLRCPRCTGRMQLIATIEDPAVIHPILAHLGLPRTRDDPRPSARPAPANFVAGSHPVIQEPDLTTHGRSARIGATLLSCISRAGALLAPLGVTCHAKRM